MYYTYIIKSSVASGQVYIGHTSDLKNRLKSHNSGESIHTKKFKPWWLEFYAAFIDKKKAIDFEKYLKSGSGRAFTKKHFFK